MLRGLKGTSTDWIWHAPHGDMLYQLVPAQPAGYQVRRWSMEAKTWCVPCVRACMSVCVRARCCVALLRVYAEPI